jgi:prophage DNA circulation protein
MSDLFLGLIALAVLVMAAIQVALLVVAARVARQASDAVARLERDVKPVVANLQALSAEATRAAVSAAARLEHAEQTISELVRRVDQVVQTLQGTIVRPARHGMAAIQGLLAVLAAFSARRRAAADDDTERTEEEESLFIG